MHGLFESRMEIQRLKEENAKLKAELSSLCPIADLPVINSLNIEKKHMQERNKQLEAENERYKQALELIIKNTVSGHVENIAKRALKGE